MIWVVIKQKHWSPVDWQLSRHWQKGLAGQGRELHGRCSSQIYKEIISRAREVSARPRGGGRLAESKCLSSSGKRMKKNRQQVRYWRAKHVESFTPVTQAWLLALQKGHSGSIWKIAETEGKTEGRETQQHQQGQPCFTALTVHWNLWELSGTPVLSP